MSVVQLAEFKERIGAQGADCRRPDRQTRKMLLYLFTGTRGGFTRLQIIMLLLDRPRNTHQLAREMGLDYKAVQHHMRVLEGNNLVTRLGEGYGVIFSLSNFLEMNIRALYEATERLERKMSSTKVYF